VPITCTIRPVHVVLKSALHHSKAGILPTQPLTTLHAHAVVSIHLQSQVITRLSVGTAFTLALTDAGELYGWGRNDAGQLGLGGGMAMDVYAMENLPRQVYMYYMLQ
jgi:Regulator of chromosome condensation (RCC1) repeat